MYAHPQYSAPLSAARRGVRPSAARRGVRRPLVARRALVPVYIYIYILVIDKAVLGRTVRAPTYVPVTVPRHAYVLVMVAYRT
jgi:hypothetical protein